MSSSLPPGIGLRYAPEHCSRLRSSRLPAIDFLEIDAEALMIDAGPHVRRLEVLRGQYRLSLHGAGLAIGAAERLDADHLRRLVLLAERLRPASVSEHLAWSSPGVIDPVASRLEPYDVRTLARAAAQVDAVQNRLGRTILIETPLVRADLPGSTYDEGGFLVAPAARTGCGILLDLANLLGEGARTRSRQLPRRLSAGADRRDPPAERVGPARRLSNGRAGGGGRPRADLGPLRALPAQRRPAAHARRLEGAGPCLSPPHRGGRTRRPRHDRSNRSEQCTPCLT